MDLKKNIPIIGSPIIGTSFEKISPISFSRDIILPYIELFHEYVIVKKSWVLFWLNVIINMLFLKVVVSKKWFEFFDF